MKQMDRRLLILMRLRQETAVRAADLAEVCECSVRTIYRDIDALCQSGVPVAAMPGEGYRLVEGYHLPPIAFTAEEAVQLLLGSDVALGLGTASQRDATVAAAAKVEAALDAETRREVDVLRQRIRIGGWRRQPPSEWLPLLQQGVLHERLLRLRYHAFSSEELSERVVEPHHLLYYENDWHLIAFCRLREGMRDFRAGRIRSAELLDERFERRADADRLEREAGPGQTVRVWIEAASVPWAKESPAFGLRTIEDTEGGAVFVYDCRDLRHLLPWVLGWGASARVLSPPDVVERMRSETAALAMSYDQS